jgi:hypothetical protein
LHQFYFPCQIALVDCFQSFGLFDGRTGNAISSPAAGQQVTIKTSFSNQQVAQDCAAIVQITDQNGIVAFIGWQQSTVGSGQTGEASTSWTPAQEGGYTVQIFV